MAMDVVDGTETKEPQLALSVSGLTKSFRRRGKTTIRAVSDVSFRVKEGEVLGLLGPNGAGKSTTIKCILGLVDPDEGRIEALGCDVRENRGRGMALMSAVLEGSRNVYWRLTPRENLDFFSSIQGRDPRLHRDYLDDLLKRFKLADRAGSPVMDLSQGMKQKVSIACALARQTPLVFLDEPTLGLDVEASYEMRELLQELAREERRTIIISSHDMKIVQEVCQRVVIIQNGQVVADDATRNLIDFFRTRAYRLEIHGEIPRESVSLLENLVGPVVITTSADFTQLEVEVPEPAVLYRLLDILRESGVVIEGISRDEPDLERAFLRIVRTEGNRQEAIMS